MLTFYIHGVINVVYYGKINPACLLALRTKKKIHVVSVSCAGLYRTKALLTGFLFTFRLLGLLTL